LGSSRVCEILRILSAEQSINESPVAGYPSKNMQDFYTVKKLFINLVFPLNGHSFWLTIQQKSPQSSNNHIRMRDKIKQLPSTALYQNPLHPSSVANF
jgi:hypothetical protein